MPRIKSIFDNPKSAIPDLVELMGEEYGCGDNI
jgi:hypothetical protein